MTISNGSGSGRDQRYGRRRISRRWLAVASVGALASGLLSACGGTAANELVWYTNPDSGGQAAVAARCSEGKPYTITTQVLPQDAGQQRIQLARRLAAGDTGIDLMSLDPPFTAEFANAGYLADIPDDLQKTFTDRSFDGAVQAATWDDQLVVAPFWSNTQVLWYRKSFLQKNGLGDLQKQLESDSGVTWDQIIDAAADNGGTVSVQANKYEGYVVWINALIAGAGGDIVSDTEKGVDASIDIDSDAGRTAAAIVEKLSNSDAAPADLSIAQEGQATTTFGGPTGAFLTNWTYTWTNYDAAQPEVKKDMGYAAYPESVEGEDSHPPYGGIGIGVSSASEKQEWSMDALKCLTDPDSQGINAAMTGNMPAGAPGYDYPDLKDIYPQDLLDLFQASLQRATPRSVSPYWSDISGAIQSIWHPSKDVTQDTPAESKDFIDKVLHGENLL